MDTAVWAKIGSPLSAPDPADQGAALVASSCWSLERIYVTGKENILSFLVVVFVCFSKRQGFFV